MKILLAEDDYASRKYTQKLLSEFGTTDATVDGAEAFAAFELALEDGEPYDLICLDVCMPNMDGIEVLSKIREAELKNKIDGEHEAKIIMITALSDMKYVDGAFDLGCDGYATKPLNTAQFKEVLERLGLIDGEKKE